MDQLLTHLIHIMFMILQELMLVTLNILDESNCGVSQISEIITVTNIEANFT